MPDASRPDAPSPDAPSPDAATPTAGRTPLPLGLLKAMRPQQWTKNVLVFAAPIAAGKIRQDGVVLDTLIAFVAFCLAAGGTYLLNDARDVESDRQHPTKHRRPIASGIVPVPVALVAGVISLVASLGVALLADRNLAFTIGAYLILTCSYTFWLKHQPVVDIVAVAAGFVIRAIAGGAATGVPISQWFYIVTSAGALFMVVGKRQGEAAELGEAAVRLRPALAAYTPDFLGYLRSMSSSLLVIAYCLWAFESAQAQSNGSGIVFFELSIVPFVVAVLRYALLLAQGKGAEPEALVLHDRPLQVAGLLWGLTYAYGLYLA